MGDDTQRERTSPGVRAGHGEIQRQVCVGRFAFRAADSADKAPVAGDIPRRAYKRTGQPHRAPQARREEDGLYIRP